MRVVCAAAVALAVLLVPTAAQAHPFGPPQTLTLSRGDAPNTVRVHWTPGAADDLSYLASGIGLDPRDITTLGSSVAYVKEDAALLQESTAFDDYLLRHVTVSSGGTPCAGAVAAKQRLVAEGAELVFDCGAAASVTGSLATVELGVTMLTDLHPAFQSLVTGPGGQRFVYAGDQTTHAWAMDASAAHTTTATRDGAALARNAALQTGAVIAALLGLGTGAGLWLRSLRRRRKAVVA